MTTGECILSLRKAKGLTQGQLGEKLGVSDKTVSKWETEGGTPDIGILTSITDFFGISLDFLMKGNAVTDGDNNASKLIKQYNTREQKKAGNAEAIKICKRLLSENGVEIKDEYLPKYNADKTAFSNYGVFNSDDISKFSLQGLLKFGLAKIALKHFSKGITFEEAVLSDDIAVYERAQENYEILKEEAGKRKPDYFGLHPKPFMGLGDCQRRGYAESTTAEVKDMSWALENLDSSLPKYYELLIWLVDNGAEYYLEYLDHDDMRCSIRFAKDPSKTKFFYRLAKDMIKCQGGK